MMAILNLVLVIIEMEILIGHYQIVFRIILNYKYLFQRNLIIVQDLHGQDFLKSRELCKVLTEKQLKKAKKLSDKICEVYADKIFFTNNYISNLSNKEMNTVNKKYNIYKKNEIYTLYNTKK
jgi:hypothetical protein